MGLIPVDNSKLLIKKSLLNLTPDKQCLSKGNLCPYIFSLNSIDRPMPLIMQRKPILPMEIRTRWQRGFRRKSGSGLYVKVPILRIEIDFDPDQVMEHRAGAI